MNRYFYAPQSDFPVVVVSRAQVFIFAQARYHFDVRATLICLCGFVSVTLKRLKSSVCLITGGEMDLK
jgi:hypothetical protein